MPCDNDNDGMPYDNDNDQMPYEYDNDNDTAITEMKYDRNMTNDELKDVGTKDVVPYKRDDNMMTKVKWPIETSDVDNDFMREYDNMHKSMEDRQINDFYEAWRHIQSAMKSDTPVKTGQNRQCIDNVTDYDREHHRIFNSVHHRLDLPNVLTLSGVFGVHGLCFSIRASIWAFSTANLFASLSFISFCICILLAFSSASLLASFSLYCFSILVALFLSSLGSSPLTILSISISLSSGTFCLCILSTY